MLRRGRNNRTFIMNHSHFTSIYHRKRSRKALSKLLHFEARLLKPEDEEDKEAGYGVALPEKPEGYLRDMRQVYEDFGELSDSTGEEESV